MSLRRIASVDVARATASLLMLQGHAFHGWASDEARTTGAYAFTRLLGTFPLPAFLVLAGAAMVLRLRAAQRRAEDPATVRAALVRRGLRVLAYGYLLSLAYALLDGGLRWPTLLRVDVLHVIGLSIALAAALGVRPGPDGHIDPGAFARRVGALGILVTLVCPWLSSWTAEVEGPARYLVGLVGDVPRVGLMPLVPLFGWLGLGAVVMDRLGDRLERPPFALALLGVAVALILVGRLGTPALRGLGEPLGLPAAGRASPAIVANVIVLGGHGLVVLAFGALVGPWLHGRAREWALRLGRGSLFVYAIHIPFCYGRLAGGLRHGLDMASATAAVSVLIAGSALALLARDTLRQRLRSGAASAPA